ncbi:hypothetical protein VHEMI04668 [[Torrubiella] hemipterigena]|uniref:Uncharacterized protein n=1 Tax=[Torrubiella] hemipterigena TaxID=1531966 RepID=A0A0A1TGV3_9HYPO|nr:hypothetical protein VHEMI04668 [[Torrubiella] hemipterigena]
MKHLRVIFSISISTPYTNCKNMKSNRILAVAGVAVAASHATASTTALGEKNIPVLEVSKAFKIVVHVTDKSMDQKPSIENHMVIPNPAGKYHPFRPARVSFDASDIDFYTNEIPFHLRGTQEDAMAGRGNIAGSVSYVPKRPFDIPMQIEKAQDETRPWLRNVTIGYDGGQNVEFVNLTASTNLISEAISDAKFIACPGEEVEIRAIDAKAHSDIPVGCTPIRLFPECVQPESPMYPQVYEKAPFARCYKAGSDYSAFD